MKYLQMLCKCGEILRIELSDDFPSNSEVVAEARRKLVWYANTCNKTEPYILSQSQFNQ